MTDTIEQYGLAHLAVLILAAEAGYGRNDIATQVEFTKVIFDELDRKGVPSEYIHGPQGPLAPHGAAVAYQTSIFEYEERDLLHELGIE